MEKINGIVLENRKHSDTVSIVTLYTRTRGRMTFVSPSGSGPKARLRAARLMPLALVDADVRVSQTKELQRLGAISSPHSWQDIYFNPIKSSLTLFLTEFLNRILRETAPDPNAWDFIRDCVCLLDESDGSLANFHIAFLINFLPFAGIMPDTSLWNPGSWFSLHGAEFASFPSDRGAWLPPEEAALLPLLARMNFRNMGHFRFHVADRRKILAGLLRFYGAHYPGADNLRCIDVLKELFADS